MSEQLIELLDCRIIKELILLLQQETTTTTIQSKTNKTNSNEILCSVDIDNNLPYYNPLPSHSTSYSISIHSFMLINRKLFIAESKFYALLLSLIRFNWSLKSLFVN